MLNFVTVGKTALTDGDGNDYMPRSMKARGIIVLLMMSPNRARSRLWLQSKLWSDRGSGQAAGSLRTALSEIRSCLGRFSQLLIADRFEVRLSTEEINFAPKGAEAYQAMGPVEPFEDIDVRDREFEQLIREIRCSYNNLVSTKRQARSKPKTYVLIEKTIFGHPIAKVGAEKIFAKLERRFRNQDEIDILHLDAGAGANHDIDSLRGSNRIIKIKILSSAANGKMFVGIEVLSLPDQRSMWSKYVDLATEDSWPSDTLKSDKLVYDLAEYVLGLHCAKEYRASNSTSALALGFEARRLLFDLSKDRLAAADGALQMAYELHPNGDFLAWRALLRIIGQHQHCGVDYLQDTAGIAELLQQAISDCSGSATVTAILSQAAYIDGLDCGTPSTLAKQAVEDDPTDPLGFAFLSNALLASGQTELAYNAAERAIALSAGSKYQYYIEHFACMAATSLERYERAYSHANMAASLKPDFVTSHRWKTALSLGMKDRERFRSSLSSLRKLEPDFSTASYSQTQYPTPTLRRLPIMDRISKAADVVWN